MINEPGASFGGEWGNVMTTIKNLLMDTSGASAAEYALILAIVGTGIAVAAFTLGGSISNAMNKASNCINTTGGATAPTC
jgi:pilus assembly protein Flp/PilA